MQGTIQNPWREQGTVRIPRVRDSDMLLNSVQESLRFRGRIRDRTSSQFRMIRLGLLGALPRKRFLESIPNRTDVL